MIELARQAPRHRLPRRAVGDLLDEPLAVNLAESPRLAHERAAGRGFERAPQRRKFVERRTSAFMRASSSTTTISGVYHAHARLLALNVSTSSTMRSCAACWSTMTDRRRLRDDVEFHAAARAQRQGDSLSCAGASCARASAVGAPASKAASGDRRSRTAHGRARYVPLRDDGGDCAPFERASASIASRAFVFGAAIALLRRAPASARQQQGPRSSGSAKRTSASARSRRRRRCADAQIDEKHGDGIAVMREIIEIGGANGRRRKACRAPACHGR